MTKKSSSILGSMFLTAFITFSIIELSTVGASLIDGIMVSTLLGPDSMAAAGIGGTIFSIVGILSGTLSVGLQTLAGAELSRGRVKEMQKLCSMTMLTTLIVSVLCSLLLFLFASPIAFFLGARGNAARLCGEAADYLRGIAVGTVPLITSVVLSTAVQLDSGGRLIRIGAIAASATDVLLDYLAVRLNMGLFGMGLASSLSYVVDFCILLIHFRKKNRLLQFTLQDLPFSSLGKIASLGSEKASRRLMNTLRPLLLNTFIITAGGALGMSALSIRNNIENFLEIPMTGIAGATALLIGIAYGEKNGEDCRNIIRLALRSILLYSLVVISGLLLFARPIASYYVRERGELRNLVLFSVCCLAFGTPFSAIAVNRTSFLQASGRLKECQLLTVMSKFVVIVACAIFCVRFWQSRGIIAAFPLSNLLICLMILAVSVRIGRKKSGQRSPLLEGYLNLPADFDPLPQDVIQLTIRDEEEAVLTAEQLQMFCLGHKINKARALQVALCLEELSVNILQHGYRQRKAAQPIDVRLVIAGDDLILRIRDHCPRFDLTERIRLIEAETDPTRNLGIRMVARMAKDIHYVYLLETNTVILTL